MTNQGHFFGSSFNNYAMVLWSHSILFDTLFEVLGSSLEENLLKYSIIHPVVSDHGPLCIRLASISFLDLEVLFV